LAGGAERSPWLAATEFFCAGAIVLAHNVFRVLPNEVPILVVLALLSMRLRFGRWEWSSLGFRRPQSWTRIFLIAVAAAAVRLVVGSFVIEPAAEHFWGTVHAPSGAEALRGNLKLVLLYLPLVWGFAAFGEEIAYRGYLLGRAADSGGGSPRAWWAAVLASSILFGLGHYYKGPAGIVDSGFAGLVLATAYLVSGRNLWTCVLAHGFMDTVAMFAVYMGWDT
jgi:hypothetical protein